MTQFNYSVAPRSVYIHWPFCPYRCHFCPFVALAGQDQFMQQYHEALCAEIRHFGSHYSSRMPLDTVFIGGGTPSTYPDAQLLDMFGTLRTIFDIQSSTEITIEVNPGTVRGNEHLELWKQVGINRLSIGVQSLKDQVLKKLNRHQSAADVFALLNKTRDLFDNVSVDLILGLPDVSQEDWKDLLTTVVTWPIKHLSMYFLTVHEDTPLYFKVKTEAIILPPDESLIDLYYWSIDFLATHGFKQYEISNFARDGMISRHNSMYWERKPYAAFGLGACSYDGSVRFQNEKNLTKYMAGAAQGQTVAFAEQLTRKQIHMEKIMLGIRRAQGVAMHDIMEDLTDDERNTIQEHIAQLEQKKLVRQADGRLVLTPPGLAVENAIASRLSL